MPEYQVRFHICWGSGHGPHMDDIQLKHFVDIIFDVKAECFSVEAANPQHDADWTGVRGLQAAGRQVFMPGVVSHVSDRSSTPRLWPSACVQYASLVGREKVIAGTDCGLASRVGHPEIAWAKFQALVEGASSRRSVSGNSATLTRC